MNIQKIIAVLTKEIGLPLKRGNKSKWEDERFNNISADLFFEGALYGTIEISKSKESGKIQYNYEGQHSGLEKIGNKRNRLCLNLMQEDLKIIRLDYNPITFLGVPGVIILRKDPLNYSPFSNPAKIV